MSINRKSRRCPLPAAAVEFIPLPKRVPYPRSVPLRLTNGRTIISPVNKGADTRERIVLSALRSASLAGLGQLTVGTLAKQLRLSKSGLFAHFGSKEQLQIAVLEEAAQRFVETAVKPAFLQPRGERRVRALFENYLAWTNLDQLPGGCVFITAVVEFDDQPGPVRDAVVAAQAEWAKTLARSAELAKETGEFRPDLDCQTFAFELQGIFYSLHHYRHLLKDAHWEKRARSAFERLIMDARV
jgi:AcrR family transcriptional regulator